MFVSVLAVVSRGFRLILSIYSAKILVPGIVLDWIVNYINVVAPLI